MSPEQCLNALELAVVNWDVHKAIKIIKLYNLMDAACREGSAALAAQNLQLCADQLENNNWSLHDTAVNL